MDYEENTVKFVQGPAQPCSSIAASCLREIMGDIEEAILKDV
jgi:hypothetical protein